MAAKENNVKTSRGELARRYGLLILGLFISALGVAVTRQAQLGVSPISSVPNVVNLKFPAISLGTGLILWNFLLIIGQILLLRRRFKLMQFLQIPVSFLFGWFTDFGVWLSGFLPAGNYAVRMALVILGTFVLAVGVSFSVVAGVVMNSGEAFVQAMSDTTGRRFGDLKIGFDVVCVAIAVVLSLVFFDFTVQGTREGTVIVALTTGAFVNVILRWVRAPLEKMIST